MGEKKDTKKDAARGERMAALEAVDASYPFGPLFFLRHLRAFVRESCPDPAEGLPVVRLRLADGDVLEVCHVMGIAAPWVALAINEQERPEGGSPMRTELVPYGLISRVTIRAERSQGPHIGFDLGHQTGVLEGHAPSRAMSPEEALRATAGVAVAGAGRVSHGPRRA